MQRRNVYKITNTTVSEKKKVEKKSKSKHENRKIENKKSINRKIEKSKNRRKNRNSGEDCYRIVCLIAISLNQHCMN